MKRRLSALLAVGLLALLAAGCTSSGGLGEDRAVGVKPSAEQGDTPGSRMEAGEPAAPSTPAKNEQTSSAQPAGGRLHDFYTMPDEAGDIAALLFLGCGEEAEAGTAAVKEAYFSGLPGGWPAETERVETEEWQEVYLLLPKYPGTLVTVQRLDVEELPVAELLTTEGPVLLCCNRSDVVPSTQVTVRYGDREIAFKPQLSMKDGSCVAAEGIYTQVFRGY